MANLRHIKQRGHTTLICEACGTEFTRPNAHIRSKTHACSRECSNKLKPRKTKTMVQYTCKVCGVIFERRKGHGGTGDCCSPRCRNKFNRPKGAIANISRIAHLPRGEDHHNWKGGITDRPHKIRAIIENKKKQIGKCEECGSTEKLEGHHIKEWSKYPELRYEPDNIQILCHSCHANKHPDIAFTGKAQGRRPNT